MVKIVSINKVELYNITCTFNDGSTKKIDVKPLLQKHHYLDGITELYNENVFKQVKIGEMGEIMWENIISIPDHKAITKWNYDISPEFVYYNGEHE